MLKLSIIIVNYNTHNLLDACLHSIYTYPPSYTFEVIVVDNGSTDDSTSMVKAKYPSVKVILNEKNLGFATANNKGIKSSSGDYILLFNSDAEFLPGAIDYLIQYLDAHPDTAICGPKLLSADKDTIQRSWWWSPTILKESIQRFMATYYIKKYSLVKSIVKFLERKVQEVELVSGACMLIRREAMEEVGLLDENLFLYFEEPDFCKRIRTHGYKIIFLPQAKIIHKLGQTMNKIGSQSNLHYIKSQIYYYRKHNSYFQQLLLKYYIYLKYFYYFAFSKNKFEKENAKTLLRIIKTFWTMPLSTTNANSKEKEILLGAAQEGIKLSNSDLTHLNNTIAVLNYIRIADEIKTLMPDGKDILDWGCGYGHMTYLLQNRRLNAVAYDVIKRNNIEKIFPFSEIDIIYGKKDDVRLPFENESFHAVLSCGTLEHVPDASLSIREIHRILKPSGLFFIYMLPNKYGWSETLATIRGISSHPVKYTIGEIRKILSTNNFKIVKIARRNFLPKNLTSMPAILKKGYGKLGNTAIFMDEILSSIPLLNLLCGTFEIIAKKDK